MNQLFKIEDTIGKTIEKVSMPITWVNDMFIKFTDGSFIILTKEDTSEGFDSDRYVICVNDSEADKTDTELFELGVITLDEHKNALYKQQERYAELDRQREITEAKRIQEYELKQLEDLKKKYGK